MLHQIVKCLRRILTHSWLANRNSLTMQPMQTEISGHSLRCLLLSQYIEIFPINFPNFPMNGFVQIDGQVNFTI
jgi:hypothetical protein